MPRVKARYPASPVRGLEEVAARRDGIHTHRVNIGQPDLRPPESVVAAMRRTVGGDDAGRIGYMPSLGLPSCRQAVAAYLKACDPGIDADDVAITHGASEALLLVLAAIARPGDEVIVVEPFYANYRTFALMLGLVLVPVSAEPGHGYALPDSRRFDAARSVRTRAVLFSNPCNPTGAVYSTEALARLASWCRRNELFLIADEVYRHLWLTEPASSILSVPDGRVGTVVIESLSKAWCAPGVRAGFIASHDRALRAEIERLCQARLGTQAVAQYALEAALALPEDYYQRRRRIWRARVASLCDALSNIEGVRFLRPAGAFYVMVELPVPDAMEFARFMAGDFQEDAETVLVAPGEGFFISAGRGRKAVRLAAVLDSTQLARVGHLLAAGLRRWKARSRHTR